MIDTCFIQRSCILMNISKNNTVVYGMLFINNAYYITRRDRCKPNALTTATAIVSRNHMTQLDLPEKNTQTISAIMEVNIK